VTAPSNPAAAPDGDGGLARRYWPLNGLRLRAGDLELRLPDEADLVALAALAEEGVHDQAVQPFSVAWTDVDPAKRGRSVLQYQWSCLGSWRPEKWNLNLVVIRGGTVIGTQGIGATDFAVLREVATGSWLGRRFQGQGSGTIMRAAVLDFAFDGLRAEYAMSDAFTDNPASLAVSRKLGYRDDGITRQVSRGKPAELQRLRMDRATWLARRTAGGPLTDPVQIEGLDPCLPLFGLG
jgi:RimJ/RimL family protein N-acetyltransferase